MNDQPGNDQPDNEEPRATLAAATNAELEAYFEKGKLPQMLAALKQAAESQDGEALRRVAAGIAAFEAKLSQWNDACGPERVSANLVACVEAMGAMRDDIRAALNFELPGQQPPESGEGEEWKTD